MNTIKRLFSHPMLDGRERRLQSGACLSILRRCGDTYWRTVWDHTGCILNINISRQVAWELILSGDN